MKRNSIARIIIFSIVILVLLAILLAGILIGEYLTKRSTRWETSYSERSDDAKPVTGRTGTASPNVRDISIEWVSGTITILPGDVDRITYQESEVADDDHRMVVEDSEGELEIGFCKDSLKVSAFGFTVDFTKDLTITVPRDLVIGTLEIDAAAVEVNVLDLTIQEVEFDGASGACTFTNCTVSVLDMDTASGDVFYSGVLTKLDFDGASGELRCELTNTPSSIQLDTMSGDLDITLPASSGFTVQLDAMSSEFSSEFPTTFQNGNHVCGDGACRISVSAMSGDVTIRKGQ